MTEMTKLIVLTDLHIRAPGETIIGLDPIARFRAALDQAVADHPDAAGLVVAGDLTNEGSDVEYGALRAALPARTPPIHWMLGNHDRRAAFRRAFPDAPTDPAGFVQQVVDLPGWRLILLDTLDEKAPDMHSGLLCADRLAWLDSALAGAAGRLPLVFAHHPPVETGFAGMDMIALRNGADLMARLTAAKVPLLVCGHVHRFMTVASGAVPVTIFKSTCHQMPLEFGPSSIHAATADPGGYGLLLLRPRDVSALSVDIA